MNGDWQSWAALGVVAITAVLYARHLLRRKGKSSGGSKSCDSDCGCGKDERR